MQPNRKKIWAKKNTFNSQWVAYASIFECANTLGIDLSNICKVFAKKKYAPTHLKNHIFTDKDPFENLSSETASETVETVDLGETV